MSVYQTEDEQVEAIKNWWKENGKSVVGGIALGAAIIVGWQGWQGWQRSSGEQASLVFDSLMQSVRIDQTDKAAEEGKRLIVEHGGSVYGSFAGLELARLAYAKGEKAAARGHLEWVAESAPDETLREIARFRLASLLLDMGEAEELAGLLAQTALPGFAGEFEVLRGDLARLQGDQDAAREAYLAALAAGVEDAELVRMKLVDVGGALPAG
jgi:predicted negative regulator of RcsB-dependent stress response